MSAIGESGASMIDVKQALSGARAETAAVVDPNMSMRNTCARRSA